MAETPLTYKEIFNALSTEDQNEISRPDFKIPLEKYIIGFNRYPLGKKADIIEKFGNWARRRREVRNEVVRNPAVHKTEFKDVFIIIGLPRSGTTMLHRLMLSDPQFIGPMAWEMIEPLPPGRPENWKDCDRFKRASQDIEFAGIAQSAIDDRHYFRMESAEECQFMLRLYFVDLIDTLVNPNMTEYRDYMYNLTEERATAVYEFMKMCLQCMFCGNMQGKTLLLKCPLHCLYPDILHKVFPTAKFIFPYRHAKSMLASDSSFANHWWKFITQEDDSLGAGKTITEFYKHCSTRIVKFLESSPVETVITLPYTEMIKDTMGSVKKIYSHFSLDLPSETQELLQSHLLENKQHKYGKVHYRAEDFGITDEIIKENMKEYLEYFAGGNEVLL